MSNETVRYEIPNLRKACEVIKVISQSQRGVGFKQLQQRTGIPRTTLMRILETLIHQQFVRQRANKSYLLGNEFLRIGIDFVNRLDLKENAAKFMKEVAENTKATCHLAVPSGGKTLVVAVHESAERVRVVSEPGLMADLHCSSTGKCFLATIYNDPSTTVDSLQLTKQTPNTILDRAMLRDELQKVRQMGYAIDNEENVEGVRGCAAPVRNAEGIVIAAVGIVAPISVFPVEDNTKIADEVCNAATGLSYKIGYHPNRA